MNTVYLRLVAIAVVAAVVLASVYALLVHGPLSDEVRHLSEEICEGELDRLTATMQREAEGYLTPLEALADRAVFHEMDRVGIAAALAEFGSGGRTWPSLAPARSAYCDIWIVNRDAEIVFAWQRAPNKRSRKDQDYIRRVLEDGEPHFGANRPLWPFGTGVAVRIGVPIRDAAGQVVGVLAGLVKTDGEDAPLRQALLADLDTTRYRAILTRGKYRLADTSEVILDARAPGETCSHPLAQVPRPRGPTAFNFRGTNYLGFTRDVPGTSWTILLQAELDPSMARTANILDRARWILGGLLVAVLIVVLGYGRRVVRPLQRLTRALGHFGATGEVRDGAPQRGSADVDRALEAFRGMALERARNEADVVDHRQKLENLALELVEVEQQTRERVAREIEELAVRPGEQARLLLGTLRDQQRSPPLETRVEQIDEVLRTFVVDVLNMRLRLAAPSLHQLGLFKALQELVRRYDEHHVTKFEFVGGAAQELPTTLASGAVFRGVREHLENVAMHAQARRAEIRLVESDDVLAIEIEDDGKGLRNLSATERDERLGRLASAGFCERLGCLGGTVTIDDDRDTGCLVRFSLSIAS